MLNAVYASTTGVDLLRDWGSGRLDASLLVRSVALGILDKLRCYRFSERNPCLIVHRVVDASPDPGIAALLADLPDEFRMLGKQICQDLATGS